MVSQTLTTLTWLIIFSKDQHMKVSVYDTYVSTANGAIMHFDILVEETTARQRVFQFGKAYLQGKGLADYPLNATECRYCHMELAPPHVAGEIKEKGYFIIEMENC